MVLREGDSASRRLLTDPQSLGAAIREARTHAGWTQAGLAERAGVSRGLVIDMERGARPRAELARVLSVLRALGLGIALKQLEGPTSLNEALDEVLG